MLREQQTPKPVSSFPLRIERVQDDFNDPLSAQVPAVRHFNTAGSSLRWMVPLPEISSVTIPMAAPVDAANRAVPISWAIVESENEDV